MIAAHRPRDCPSREVEDQLQRSGYYELRRVQCRCAEGVATLSGRVGSYYLKQVAQTIAGRLPKVAEVVNRLEVEYPRWSRKG